METFDALAEHEGHKVEVRWEEVNLAGYKAPAEMMVLFCTTDDKELSRFEKPGELRVIGEDGSIEFSCPHCDDSPFRYTEADGYTIRTLEAKVHGDGWREAISGYETTTTYDGGDAEWLCRSCARPVILPDGWDLDYA
jgi:hypothetical protein